MTGKTYSGKALVASVLAVGITASALILSGCDRLKDSTSSTGTSGDHTGNSPSEIIIETSAPDTEIPETVLQTKFEFSTEETEKLSTDVISNPDITDTACDLILNFELRYFLSALDDSDLTTVCKIYSSAVNFSDRCVLPGNMDHEKLSGLISVMRAECPELFHVDFENITISDNDIGNLTEISIKYTVTESEYLSMLSDAERVIDSLVSSSEEMDTVVEKEKLVFDFFAVGCTYDIYSPNANNAYGAITGTSTSSIGVSLAIKWVMEELGIRCICVTADCIRSDIPHAWNIIEIDGEFFTLDVTPSIRHNSTTSSADNIVYCAFNMSDYWTDNNYFIHDCFTDIAPIPTCNTSTESYFAKLGYFIERGGDPSDALTEQLRNTDENTVETAYLQFENSHNLESFVSDIDAYLNGNNINYSSLRYDLFEYNVCVIYINE